MRRWHDQRGFSLLELLITMVLLSVISVVVGRVMFAGYDTMLTADRITQSGWQGLMALDRISNDVHRIRSPSDISTASASTLAFTDVSGTSITYTLSGGNLTRNGVVLASGVQSLSFSYLDGSGVATGTPSAIRYVNATIGLNADGLTTSLSTMVGTRGFEL